MQQRGTGIASMETECEDKSYQGRGRNLSKLKVLVRSHAMREETSPPREPTPTPLLSPCIKLTPSPIDSPNGNGSLLIVSPSVSRRNSPARSSPSSTIVPSPTRYSPNYGHGDDGDDNNDEVDDDEEEEEEADATSQIDYETIETNHHHHHHHHHPTYLNNNKINARHNNNNHMEEKMHSRTDIIVEETSHLVVLDNRNKGKCYNNNGCDCVTSQSYCVKCAKVDKHTNNNVNCNNNNSHNNNNNNNNSNTLTVNRANFKGKFKHQSSSQGSFEGSSSNSPCLSRDSSSEQYTDTTGVDLELFIPETLNRNAKDRAIMLRIEQELVNLAKDKTKSHYKFPPMSSYQRMLVHRCAAYFGMDHNIESSGKSVVVNKTKNTRIPEVPFKQHIKSDIVFSEEPRRSILKRDSNSTEDYNFKSPDRQHSFENRRSKSFEEREEEYEKVRRRIFSVEMPYSSNDDIAWSDEIPWSSVESENSSRLRLPSEHHNHSRSGGGRLVKVQSEEVGADTLRPCVAKSYSFGGYGGVSVLTRGDSVASTRSEGAKLLIKQDSAASSVSWRLSPSSSGYKTQSQRSESVTPSPTSTPYLSGQDSTNSVATNTSDTQIANVDSESSDNQLVWAVTDIESVPKGSVIINPQTWQPVKNNDGSIYHYDPRNPPPVLNSANVASKPPPSPQKSISPNKVKDRATSPKKRPPRTSPVKKSITNSSTSPSLPFTPPSSQTRIFPSYIQSNDSIANVPIQTQYPVYGSNYGPTPEGLPLPVYQQPYIVYTAPYSMSVPFEGRNESALPEMSGYYVNIPAETQVNAAVQPVTYQTQPLWNQQPVFYPNVAPNHTQRFTVPMPTQSGSYMPTTYPTNFVPSHGQNIPAVPQPPQTPDVVSVYSQPPVHVVYPPNAAHANGMVYPNQGVVCNTQMYAPLYPTTPALPYPQSTSTPNSCTSSVSNTAYCGQLPTEMNAQNPQQQQQQPPPPQPQSQPPSLPNYAHHLVQNMSQMSLNAAPASLHQPAYNQNSKMLMQNLTFDGGRNQKGIAPKGGNKFANNNNPRSFVMNSSQSSTGTSSPATTVVAGYFNNHQPQNVYRTPPPSETPTIQHCYGANYQHQPFRQNSIIQNTSPPNTSRNSRSPTPGSDVLQLGDMKQRFPIASVPHVYAGMSYVLQTDTRIVPARGQPNAYRQQYKPQHFQNADKMHKNRKSRGNKLTNVQQPNTKL